MSNIYDALQWMICFKLQAASKYIVYFLQVKSVFISIVGCNLVRTWHIISPGTPVGNTIIIQHTPMGSSHELIFSVHHQSFQWLQSSASLARWFSKIVYFDPSEHKLHLLITLDDYKMHLDLDKIRKDERCINIVK